jgi:single-strand DNA-binding protein
MASFNRVILLGNLTRDPELRYIQSGTAVTDIGLAVNDRRKNANGEWIDEPTFVDITLWGRTAEVASEYLTKGSPVLIEGRLKYDAWETPEGQKRSKLKVIGENMRLLGSRAEGSPPPQGRPARPPAGPPADEYSQPAPPDNDNAPPPDAPGGDEIPF